jgi:hypothetical protein
VNAALLLFLQQLGTTLAILGAVITLARRREIASFCSTHYSKARTILRLEGENAQLRASLAASTLANEGWEARVQQLSDEISAFRQARVNEVAELREAVDRQTTRVDTLTAKFVSGIAFIATELAHGDTSRLPALIRDDVEVEIQRQSRSAQR